MERIAGIGPDLFVRARLGRAEGLFSFGGVALPLVEIAQLQSQIVIPRSKRARRLETRRSLLQVSFLQLKKADLLQGQEMGRIEVARGLELLQGTGPISSLQEVETAIQESIALLDLLRLNNSFAGSIGRLRRGTSARQETRHENRQKNKFSSIHG